MNFHSDIKSTIIKERECMESTLYRKKKSNLCSKYDCNALKELEAEFFSRPFIWRIRDKKIGAIRYSQLYQFHSHLGEIKYFYTRDESKLVLLDFEISKPSGGGLSKYIPGAKHSVQYNYCPIAAQSIYRTSVGCNQTPTLSKVLMRSVARRLQKWIALFMSSYSERKSITYRPITGFNCARNIYTFAEAEHSYNDYLASLSSASLCISTFRSSERILLETSKRFSSPLRRWIPMASENFSSRRALYEETLLLLLNVKLCPKESLMDISKSLTIYRSMKYPIYKIEDKKGLLGLLRNEMAYLFLSMPEVLPSSNKLNKPVSIEDVYGNLLSPYKRYSLLVEFIYLIDEIFDLKKDMVSGDLLGRTAAIGKLKKIQAEDDFEYLFFVSEFGEALSQFIIETKKNNLQPLGSVTANSACTPIARISILANEILGLLPNGGPPR